MAYIANLEVIGNSNLRPYWKVPKFSFRERTQLFVVLKILFEYCL